MKTKPRKKWLLLLVLALAVFFNAASGFAEPWKFGVMSDTQWSNAADAANNPGTVAVGIISQLNSEFIHHGVRFVLQVGDLDDKEANYNGLPQSPRLGISTRAAAAQALYASGIGFFPVRGNHEGSRTAAVEVQNYFPQTQGGVNSIGAIHFSSPSNNLTGLSYSFDYNNARFMLLDQFTPTDGKASDDTTYSLDNNAVFSQQAWINNTLSTKPANTHAFVFSHKQLFGGKHTDTLFGSPTIDNSPPGFRNPNYASQQNVFIGSLKANIVGYLFTGHDHMHNRSIVFSPNGVSKIHQVICASNSYKFYTPQAQLSAHGIDTVGSNAGQNSKNRETEISQELYSVGYYIVTVDGPRVTVDFYSADPTPDIPGLADVDLQTTPTLTFSKRETFGYSLNGQEFLVSQTGPYTVVTDKFQNTTAQILDGKNTSNAMDYNGRPLTKAVDTGWTPMNNDRFADKLASNILTLWGMADLGSEKTENYVLSISYDKQPTHQGNGGFGIAARDKDGNWVNAVDKNIGGVKNFVHGLWKQGYELGTYGVASATRTAWAVINYNGDFAVARDIEPVPGHRP